RLPAKGRELLHRNGAGPPASDVEGMARHLSPGIELAPDKVAQVVRVQQVAYLQALAAESGVLKLPSEKMPRNQQREYSLVGLAELSRPRDHAAAIDHHRQPR